MSSHNLVDQLKVRFLYPIYRDWAIGRNERGNYERAIRDCDRAIGLRPHDPICYAQRGIAHYQLRQNAEALRDLDKALDIDPTMVSAYFNRGNVHFSDDNYPEAIRNYNLALHHDPTLTKGYYNRGLVAAKQGNYASALSDYSQAIALSPDAAYIYGNRGEVYFIMGKYEKALADFRTAHQQRPLLRRAIAGMAVACHALGEKAKALMLWEALLERNSGYQNAAWVENEHAWDGSLIAEVRGLLASLNANQ
jgi:tetratricopeptide (TPR) repeat protein